jgi:hypothetical protein
MGDTDIGSTDYGALESTETKFEVDTATTDGVGDQKETTWINSEWSQQFGYYKNIPELHACIDARAEWAVGNGYTAEPLTKLVLLQINGNGTDTFNTILENMMKVKDIGGDSFSEIIRNEDKQLINIKPLDPSVMKIVANQKGIIIRYEQVSKIGEVERKFKPEEVLHFSRNRIADEIHGQSLITAVENIILMRNEGMSDARKLYHRHVHPVMVHHLNTDNTTEIAAYKAKVDAAHDKGENLYIPKDAVEIDMAAVAPNASLNILPYIESLNNYFYEACGVPKVIVGSSGALTEASAKILLLAFEQTTRAKQLYVKEQISRQLGLTIELEFSVSIQNEAMSSTQRSENSQFQPNDITAGSGQ